MEEKDQLDEAAIVDSVVSILSRMPAERLQPVLTQVHRQLRDNQGAPVADPSIRQLHHWGRLSTRSCMALEQYGAPLFDLGHDKVVRLSHVATLTLRALAKIPNLGALCCHEIVATLADYGWRLRDAHDLPAKMTRDVEDIRRRLADEQVRRRISDERNHALLREKADERLSWETLAERHGYSAAPLRSRLVAFERTMQFREANPLPPTIHDSAKADPGNGV